MSKYLALIVISVLVLVFFQRRGHSNWIKYVSGQVQKIDAVTSHKVEQIDLAQIDGLPEPVKQYFHLVLKDQMPMINSAFVEQVGEFRAKPEMKDWLTMKAVQYFSARPRAFVWNAKITILPGLSINVSDSYLEGNGSIKGMLSSIVKLIDSQSQPELNEGALQRFLAEAVWFPTALLPSQGVSWVALDANRAKATISDAGITTSLVFEFNTKGEIVSVYAPARYREISGKFEATPWKGRFSNYININGYLIPEKAEVEWHLKDRVYPYWRAKLKNVTYK